MKLNIDITIPKLNKPSKKKPTGNVRIVKARLNRLRMVISNIFYPKTKMLVQIYMLNGIILP